jgi:hypothetical protein
MRLAITFLSLLAIGVSAFVLVPAARAITFTDAFEGGTNAAGWSYIQGFDIIEGAGGNPGGWLHQPLYDTFDPAVRSEVSGGTPFTGDYHAAEVTKISFDLQTLDVDFGDGTGFPVVLLLRRTNGTPDDIFDDDYAYTEVGTSPAVGSGWQHYEALIPSQSNDAVPAGWLGGSIDDCENFRPGVTWTDIMQSVDQVEIHFLTPCMFAIFQQWNVGADNISIEYVTEPTSVEATSWGAVKNLYR